MYSAFILDTNVLLHDPEALFKFKGHRLILPLVVLEELGMMKGSVDELGKNAREVIRLIGRLTGDLFQGVALDNGTTLSLHRTNRAKQPPHFPFPLDQNKHLILLAAYQLKEEGGQNVVLISKDLVMRLKAESIGISAENYDYMRNGYDSLYLGVQQQVLSKKSFDEFSIRGFTDLPELSFYPNEYCSLISSEDESVALGRFNHKSQRLEMIAPLPLNIWGIKPLNEEQKCAINLLLDDDIHLVTLIGFAGTGKTLLALTCGLRKVFDEGAYRKIVISRPVMPLGRDIGFLPGTKEEKIYHWMQPIYDNLEVICGQVEGGSSVHSVKQWVMESEKLEMEAVTFIRGRSFTSVYLIIDEAQNLTPHEMKTIISRAGKGTKVILTGDPTQIDHPYLDRDSNALTYIVGKFKHHSLYGHIFFQKSERSALASLTTQVL